MNSILVLDSQPLRIALAPGNATAGADRPVVPPSKAGWSLQGAVAVRICRQGKSIEPQFAGRYYDAVAPVVVMRPEGDDALSYLTDNIIKEGEWTPVDGNRVILQVGDDRRDADLTAVDDVLVGLSRFSTLHMGDRVVLLADSPFGAQQDYAIPSETTILLNDNTPQRVKIR